MFPHTVVVMLALVIGGDFCVIKDESAPLEILGQGAFKEMSGQPTPYPMEPDHVPMETVYIGEGKPSMDDFVDRLEQGIGFWAPNNIKGMNIRMLKPFPPEYEEDEEEEEEEDEQTAKWNAMRLKLKNQKLSAYIVGVAPEDLPTDIKTMQYFFLILKYAHLKFIQRSIGDEIAAKAEAETYIDDPQFETHIQVPIWVTNGNAVLETSAPISVIPERHWGADYQVLTCWKLPRNLGVHRYISMLKHESEHAHWFFVFAFMYEAVTKPTLINYVGGYMNSPEMAEISVLNFINVSHGFRNGEWRDSSSQPGTWSGAYSEISWKAETPKKAIIASIDKIVASEAFLGPKDLTGVDISYFFAIGTRHMPCPISPEEHSLYLLHSIDYYWITVQVPDSKGGVHLISIVHRYMDNIYCDTILEEYGGYYPVETSISVTDSDGNEVGKDGNEPCKTRNRFMSPSDKKKSTNPVASMLRTSRILNRTKSQSQENKSTISVPSFLRSKSGRDVSKVTPP